MLLGDVGLNGLGDEVKDVARLLSAGFYHGENRLHEAAALAL